MQLPTLGLYIHLPWCERKCPYCDFNSHERHDLPEADYVRALLNDLRQDLPLLQGRARAVFWHRLRLVLFAALLPLPLVVAADVWLLGRAYELFAAWLPASVALYMVVSYAAWLLILIGGTYAAIPLLLAWPVPEPDGSAG